MRKNQTRAANPFGFTFMAPLILGSALNPINSTMLATALVPIASSLRITAAQSGWLIAVLYLTSAVAQPTMGRLVDLFGPRRVFLAALSLVGVAGVAGWNAPSLNWLIVSRILLGIGTSGAYPSAMRLFRMQADRIGGAPPRISMGLLSLASIATMAVGPLIGGLLTDAFGWRSIFTVNLPLALLTALLVLLWIPKDEQRKENASELFKDADLPGIFLFAAFLLGLMIFLMNLSRPAWLALLFSAVFCAAFIFHSLRRKNPFINVRMLAHNSPLVVTYIRAAAMSMIMYCILYGFAQWLESSVGLSSAAAGVMTLPLSIVSMISSVTGVRTKGLRAPFLISIAAALIGSICLYFIHASTALWIIATAVMFFGAPQGMFSTATQAAVYIQAPPDEIGSASGLQRTAQYIGPIATASLLAILFGQRATDCGLHGLALVMGAVSAVLLIATVFDRTIPGARGISAAGSAKGTAAS